MQYREKSVNINSEVKRLQIIVEYLHQLNMSMNYWMQLDIKDNFMEKAYQKIRVEMGRFWQKQFADILYHVKEKR